MQELRHRVNLVIAYLKGRGAVTPCTAVPIHEVKRWIIGKGWYKNENSMKRFWGGMAEDGSIVVVNDSIRVWSVYTPTDDKEFENYDGISYSKEVIDYLKDKGAISLETALDVHTVKEWILSQGFYKNIPSMTRFWKNMRKKHLVSRKVGMRRWVVYLNPLFIEEEKPKEEEKRVWSQIDEWQKNEVIQFIISKRATRIKRAIKNDVIMDWVLEKKWYNGDMQKIVAFLEEVVKDDAVHREQLDKGIDYYVVYCDMAVIRKREREKRKRDAERVAEEEQSNFTGIVEDDYRYPNPEAVRENAERYYANHKKKYQALKRFAAIAQHLKEMGAIGFESAVDVREVKEWILERGWYANENSMKKFWNSLLDSGTLVATRWGNDWRVHHPHDDFVYLNGYFPEGSHYLIETLK